MKKNTILLTGAILSLSICDVSAESKVPVQISDSVRLDEVVITGSLSEVSKRQLPLHVEVIGRDEIERRKNYSLLPLLSERVPGMFVTQRGVMGYGVAAGSAGSMTMRGIGGSPNTQLLVLIDGHPQYMGLMGHPLPDMYESSMAEKIEVVKGPASYLYGSNAMGGVVNIITRAPDSRKPSLLRANVMYGSYNTASANASYAYQKDRWDAYVSGTYNHTDGHRRNSEFNQWSGYGKVGYQISEHYKTRLDFNITRFKASNPGTTEKPIIDNDARVLRGMTSLSIENKYDNLNGALNVYVNFGDHKINDGYFEGAKPKDYYFRSKDNMWGATFYQTASLFTGNSLTAGVDFKAFGGNAYNDFMETGEHKQLVDKHIYEMAGYANMRQSLNDRLYLSAGIRYDHNSHTGGTWVPFGGLSFIAAPQTVLKAVVSKGFRNPTIREMYMFPPQNPDLKPESLINYELSASQGLFSNRLQLDLSIYYLDAKNLIQTVRTDGRPQNINTGRVKNFGVEFMANYKVLSNFSLNTNYSYVHMKEPVLAAPKHQFYFGGTCDVKDWSFQTGIQYINKLYTQTAPALTDNFTLWNASVAYSPLSWLEIYAKVENILNQSYQINAGFPMPGANAYGGIKITI
ncbi:MAG: TonB-dependent receptor plug domain-containing protein [Bacteroidales bacterium]